MRVLTKRIVALCLCLVACETNPAPKLVPGFVAQTEDRQILLSSGDPRDDAYRRLFAWALQRMEESLQRVPESLLPNTNEAGAISCDVSLHDLVEFGQDAIAFGAIPLALSYGSPRYNLRPVFYRPDSIGTAPTRYVLLRADLPSKLFKDPFRVFGEIIFTLRLMYDRECIPSPDSRVDTLEELVRRAGFAQVAYYGQASAALEGSSHLISYSSVSAAEKELSLAGMYGSELLPWVIAVYSSDYPLEDHLWSLFDSSLPFDDLESALNSIVSDVMRTLREVHVSVRQIYRTRGPAASQKGQASLSEKILYASLMSLNDVTHRFQTEMLQLIDYGGSKRAFTRFNVKVAQLIAQYVGDIYQNEEFAGYPQRLSNDPENDVKDFLLDFRAWWFPQSDAGYEVGKWRAWQRTLQILVPEQVVLVDAPESDWCASKSPGLLESGEPFEVSYQMQTPNENGELEHFVAEYHAVVSWIDQQGIPYPSLEFRKEYPTPWIALCPLLVKVGACFRQRAASYLEVSGANLSEAVHDLLGSNYEELDTRDPYFNESIFQVRMSLNFIKCEFGMEQDDYSYYRFVTTERISP